MASKKKTATAPPEEAAQLVKVEETAATERLTTVSGWEITDQGDMDACGELAAEARDCREKLEEELKKITAPMRSAEKAVRDLFRPAISTNQQVEDICKRAICAFEHKKMLEARAARQEVEAKGGVADEKTLLVAHGHGAVQTASNISTKRVFRFEIVDASKIPDAYWTRVLNEKLIQSAIDTNGGGVEIPGIKVVEDIEVKHRARR